MSFTAKAQYAYEYQNTTVTTPTGVPVNALQFKYWVYNDFTSEEQALEDYQMTHNYNCEVISSSTKYYNCHGYAWHNVEGNMEQDKLRWINDIDYNSTPTYNVHRYYSTVHSNGKPSYFSFSISGPSTVCDQATYSIENLPSGATVEWTTSSNIVILSGQGNSSVRVPKSATGNYGAGNISASILLNHNNIGTVSRSIDYVGTPVAQSISEPSYLYVGATGSYTAEPSIVGDGIQYRWYVDSSGASSSPWNNTNSITFYQEGTYDISCQILSSCGYGSAANMVVRVERNRGFSFSLSPNPAGEVVTLQLIEKDRESGQSILSIARSMYEIQLWSGMRMLRSYKTNEPTFQIPVSGLPAGLYFVRVIKDGQAHTEKLMIK